MITEALKDDVQGEIKVEMSRKFTVTWEKQSEEIEGTNSTCDTDMDKTGCTDTQRHLRNVLRQLTFEEEQNLARQRVAAKAKKKSDSPAPTGDLRLYHSVPQR